MINLQQVCKEVLEMKVSIDVSLYITTVLSILMTYGIFLSFLQFAVKDNSEVTNYLDGDLYARSLFSRNFCARFLSSKKYLILMAMVIAIPLINKILVLGSKYADTVNKLKMAWYALVILIVIIFTIAFLKAAKAILRILFIEEKRYLQIEASKLNQKIMKKYCKPKKMDSDLFIELVKWICSCWSKDKGGYNQEYEQLVYDIANYYVQLKREELKAFLHSNSDKIHERLIRGSLYVFKCFDEIFETLVLKEVECGNYIKFIKVRNELLKIDLKVYLETVEITSTDYLRHSMETEDISKKISDIFSIYHFLLKRFPMEFIQNQGVLNKIQIDLDHITKMENAFCKQEGQSEAYYLSIKIFDTMISTEQQKNDLGIIHTLCKTLKYLKSSFCYWLADYVGRSKTKIKLDKIQNILKVMPRVDKAYIILHMFMFYSIYSWREEWDYFDIALIREIISDKEKMLEVLNEDFERVYSMLKSQDDMHRLSKDMLYSFKEYLSNSSNLEQLHVIREEGILDYRYYFVLRAVCWKDFEKYSQHRIKNDDMKDGFLHFIAKHPELFKESIFEEIFSKLRYDTYCRVDLGEMYWRCFFEEMYLAQFYIDDKWMKDALEQEHTLSENTFKYLLLRSVDYYYDNRKDIEEWLIENCNFYLREKTPEQMVKEIVDSISKYFEINSEAKTQILLQKLNNLSTLAPSSKSKKSHIEPSYYL